MRRETKRCVVANFTAMHVNCRDNSLGPKPELYVLCFEEYSILYRECYILRNIVNVKEGQK